MNDSFIVIQFNAKTHERYIHLIHLEKARQYQQLVSLDAFHRGRRKLNRHDGFIFMAQFPDEFEVECQIHDYGNVPRIQHFNAWDYFRYIGFDWQSKRWI